MNILYIKPDELQLLYAKKGLLSAFDCDWDSIKIPGLISKSKLDSTKLQNSISAMLAKRSGSKKSNDCLFVLHSSLYTFLRLDIALNLAASETRDYVRNRVHEVHGADIAKEHVDYFVTEFGGKKSAFVYVMANQLLSQIKQICEACNVKLAQFVPQHQAMYTIFEKTVRFEKLEHILFCEMEDGSQEGMFFDTFGPIDKFEPWRTTSDFAGIETVLANKAREFESKYGLKLNRLILSGAVSEKVRQDTFTKNVGVWTNPLKRIIPNFYSEYASLFTNKLTSEVLPFMNFAVPFAAYICSQEGKTFDANKVGSTQKTISYSQTVSQNYKSKETPKEPPMRNQQIPPSFDAPKKSFRFPKEILLFLVIFLVTFGVFYFIANGTSGEGGVNIANLLKRPTETPVPTVTQQPPTPTPTTAVAKDELVIRVLNGTGVPGQANGVKKLLTDAGYTNVTTGNAAQYGYTKSQLNIKSGKIDVLESVLTKDIADVIKLPKVSKLEDSDDADVEIIVGSDAN